MIIVLKPGTTKEAAEAILKRIEEFHGPRASELLVLKPDDGE